MPGDNMLRFCFKNMSRLKSKKGDSPTLKSLHLKKKLHSQKKKQEDKKKRQKTSAEVTSHASQNSREYQPNISRR